jgi:hypothetical protein
MKVDSRASGIQACKHWQASSKFRRIAARVLHLKLSRMMQTLDTDFHQDFPGFFAQKGS